MNSFRCSLSHAHAYIQWIRVFTSSFVPPLYMNISSLKDKLEKEFTDLTIIWHTKTFRKVSHSLTRSLSRCWFFSPSIAKHKNSRTIFISWHMTVMCTLSTPIKVNILQRVRLCDTTMDYEWTTVFFLVIFIRKSYSSSLLSIHLFSVTFFLLESSKFSVCPAAAVVQHQFALEYTQKMVSVAGKRNQANKLYQFNSV